MSWDAEVRPLAPIEPIHLLGIARTVAGIPLEAPIRVEEYGYRHVPCGAIAAIDVVDRGFYPDELDDHPGWAVTIQADSGPDMVEVVERIVWNLMSELSLIGIPSEHYDPQHGTWTDNLPRLESA